MAGCCQIPRKSLQPKSCSFSEGLGPGPLVAALDLLQEFAARELLPNAARWDEEKHFPIDTLRSAASLGFAGLFCREDVGGTGYVGARDSAEC